jgi:hypothetical protein
VKGATILEVASTKKPFEDEEEKKLLKKFKEEMAHLDDEQTVLKTSAQRLIVSPFHPTPIPSFLPFLTHVFFFFLCFFLW